MTLRGKYFPVLGFDGVSIPQAVWDRMLGGIAAQAAQRNRLISCDPHRVPS